MELFSYRVKRLTTMVVSALAIVCCAILVGFSSRIVQYELGKQFWSTTDDYDEVWKEELALLVGIFVIGLVFHCYLLVGAWREIDIAERLLTDVIRFVTRLEDSANLDSTSTADSVDSVK